MDLSYLKQRKVFGQLVVHFRFGREKDEVMGLKFYQDFILQSKQIYPLLPNGDELTDVQVRNAFSYTLLSNLFEHRHISKR